MTRLIFLLFLSLCLCPATAQSNFHNNEPDVINKWQKRHELKLIRSKVNNDSINNAKAELDRNMVLYQNDSLSLKDVKQAYLEFYKYALAIKIDSIDSVIQHSNRLVYDATLYSNLVYSGLSLSGEKGFHPAFDHSITLISRKGFYGNAGLSYWKRLDSINYKYLGLGYSKSFNLFSYDISYQRLFLNYGTLREKNELKHSFNLYSNLDLSWFNLGVDASYLFGINQLFAATANAEFCIRGTSLFQPLSSWKLGFDILAYAATDEVYLHNPKGNKNPKSRKYNEKLTSYFGLAAYEFRIPFVYTVKKFTSAITLNYALPMNNITGNRYIKKSELPETNPNQFYITLVISYNILLNKRK